MNTYNRLLVVDDNESNCDMLARRLRRQGYEVTIASDGQQALNVMVDQGFDLVLLDIMMPVMDGIAVLTLLRKTYGMTELPVIMVTAKEESSDIVGALELGANDYVTKPLDFPVVRARIETQLALKKANDEIRSLAVQLETRNEFIQNLFGRYVSSEVVNSLLSSPGTLKSGGELRKITIMIADLRGFTSLSDYMAPEQIVAILNNYLGTMAEIVGRYGGIVDEFLGDGVLAFFGAPLPTEDHAKMAIACAVEMQLAMNDVNERNRAQGLPRVEMGVAINSGHVVVGNIGSEQRLKYTAVGQDVNLTARIESYSVGGQILISDATLQDAGAVVKIRRRRMVYPKGTEQAVTIYEIEGIGGEFDLFLHEEQETLHALESAVPVACTLLENKQLSERIFEGVLVKLAANGGELHIEDEIMELSDVKIQLKDEAGTTRAGYLYGKVLGRHAEEEHGLSIRFTSVSPEMVEMVSELLRTCGDSPD